MIVSNERVTRPAMNPVPRSLAGSSPPSMMTAYSNRQRTSEAVVVPALLRRVAGDVVLLELGVVVGVGGVARATAPDVGPEVLADGGRRGRCTPACSRSLTT